MVLAMISFCVRSWWLPVSHPNRLCWQHVRQLSYSKRLLLDGYTSTASSGNRRIGALNQNKRLLRFGLTAKRQRDVPTHVGAAVVAVSAGYQQTCAVRSDGLLVRYGHYDVPTDLGAVVAVSAGGLHTCAVRSDGQLVCFGGNASGQCDVPTDLRAVVAVSAGDQKHVCSEIRWSVGSALDKTGSDLCDVPTNLGAVVAVSAGDRHTCAVKSEGQLVCFGRNTFGQCDVPTDLGAVVAVSAGSRPTCTVRSDGQLVCFGQNTFGQCYVPTNLGASSGSLSREPAHVCSEIRWSIGLLWKEQPRTMRCADEIWNQLWQSQQAPVTRVQ